MWSKARAVGSAQALSTGRCRCAKRIVHMSTAWRFIAVAWVVSMRW